MSVSISSFWITQALPVNSTGVDSGCFFSFFSPKLAPLGLNSAGLSGRSLGIVINPATAEAATTAGEARNTSPLPCLPAKFRLPVLITISSRPFCPTCPEAHPAQPALETRAPASLNIFIRPSSRACCQMASVEGTILSTTPGATFLPCKILAAERRSSSRPFVQLPIKAESIFWPFTSTILTSS